MIKTVKELGMTDARPIKTADIYFDESLREACKSNACGKYGKNWSCAPEMKPVSEIRREIQSHEMGLMVQYVGQLEDSYDFEGMYAHNDIFRERFLQLIEALRPHYRRVTGYGAGSCPVCAECSYVHGKPCVYPDRQMISVEASGIFVARTLENSGLKYNNGPNTVTYAGLITWEN